MTSSNPARIDVTNALTWGTILVVATGVAVTLMWLVGSLIG